MLTNTIQVIVVYATPQGQFLENIVIDSNATVADAIRASALRVNFPELDLATPVFAIYGKPATYVSRLHDRDRIEVTRPLVADPKHARRTRAQKYK